MILIFSILMTFVYVVVITHLCRGKCRCRAVLAIHMAESIADLTLHDHIYKAQRLYQSSTCDDQ